VVALKWGHGLLSFSPEAKLGRQIAEVRIHGRSAAKGEVIVGVARKGDESGRDPRSKSGGERVITALSDEPVLNIRAAVHTQAEADARAKAVLQDRAQDFVTGTGESIGVPELLPDTNITISGLGRAFSKTYYVSEATHKIDSNGYRTSFKVEEPTV
jgi:phage protein D